MTLAIVWGGEPWLPTLIDTAQDDGDKNIFICVILPFMPFIQAAIFACATESVYSGEILRFSLCETWEERGTLIKILYFSYFPKKKSTTFVNIKVIK